MGPRPSLIWPCWRESGHPVVWFEKKECRCYCVLFEEELRGNSSLGGVYYPGGDRAAWSISAVARIEQNFEQRGSGIKPGADLVVDWGAGRMFRVANHQLDVGLSGFGVWQITAQEGGPPGTDDDRYRLFGVGPEASLSLFEPLTLRVRAHWELAAHDIVRGNSLWIISQSSNTPGRRTSLARCAG
jgi:hypothetical protein